MCDQAARPDLKPPLANQSLDMTIAPLVEDIRKRHGETVLAILVYGSWLRGQRDTMLDFYVLVENYHTLHSRWQDWMCRLLPPNVYQIHHQRAGQETRAKYALLTLKRFEQVMVHDFHSYFWARFAQPCGILYVRNAGIRARLEEAFGLAAATFVRRVLPSMPKRFSSEELWTRGLGLTYRCELRTESGQRGDTIFAHNPDYYDNITRALAGSGANFVAAPDHDGFVNQSSDMARRFSMAGWWLRRYQGKLLSMLRLIKAAFTFNDPLDYLVWKIERHSGIYIAPTQRQRRHPLIFAWPLLWRLYRRGAFH